MPPRKILILGLSLLAVLEAMGSLAGAHEGAKPPQTGQFGPFLALAAPHSQMELPPTLSSSASGRSVESVDLSGPTFTDRLKENFGLTYFTFLYGPGLSTGQFHINPNHLGNPANDGISAQNHFSLRWKFSPNFALDLQVRFRLILNNGTQSDNFQHFRWEAPRIGISGRLMGGEDWSVVGAVNTDFPCFLPAPFSGYQAQKRTVLFNPGMFAGFKYTPRRSRWSVFSVLSPRYFFYRDRNSTDDQQVREGMVAQNKPELIIALQPTVSYAFSEKVKITVGSSLDYRKHVLSDWNPLRASLISNGSDPAWRLAPIPISLGVSVGFSEAFNLYPFISCFPIAVQRRDDKTREQASFIQSASVGMWVNGTIF